MANWRPVVGFEGWYEVSDSGQVKRIAKAEHGGSTSKPGKVLRPGKMPRKHFGYHNYILHKSDGKRHNRTGHRLVAEAFLGPRPRGKEVAHLDGNGYNNNINNLCYVTHSENERMANAMGRKGGESHHLSKLTVEKVKKIRDLWPTHTAIQLSRMFNVSTTTVHRAAIKQTWKYI